ncbi:MAG: hypothetical protein AAB400_04505 [Patescibacteria group bacterium]
MKTALSIHDRLSRVHFFDHVVDLSKTPLSNIEILALGCCIKAAERMTELYVSQTGKKSSDLFFKYMNEQRNPEGRAIFRYLQVHGSPWDSFDHDEPFVPGIGRRPAKGPFYPTGLTQDEWDAWLQAHPDDKEAFESPYTVIERGRDGLVAVPYHNHYSPLLTEAANFLEVGATYLQEGPLKTYLELRAQTFKGTASYFDSDSAWVDTRGEPFEITLGPCETYIDDQFLGLKSAFEAYIGIPNREATEMLQQFNQPAAEFDRLLAQEYPFEPRPAGPMIVLDDVYRGGEARFGRMFVAANLPNDRKIHNLKGSKKIFSRTMLSAKFGNVGVPIAQRILHPADQAYCTVENRLASNVGHELSHGMGPTGIMRDGELIRFGVILKDLHSMIEEAKADMLGIRFLHHCCTSGILGMDTVKGAIATELICTIMGLRKSFTEAHARGNLVQYNWLKNTGAWRYNESTGCYTINYDVALNGMIMLSDAFLRLQLGGSYDAAREFVETWGSIPPELVQIVKSLSDIPLEVHPRFDIAG